MTSESRAQPTFRSATRHTPADHGTHRAVAFEEEERSLILSRPSIAVSERTRRQRHERNVHSHRQLRHLQQKTRKTCAVQRENGIFLLPAKSQNVNTVATLSPSEAADHSDVHVEEAGSARTKR